MNCLFYLHMIVFVYGTLQCIQSMGGVLKNTQNAVEQVEQSSYFSCVALNRSHGGYTNMLNVPSKFV